MWQRLIFSGFLIFSLMGAVRMPFAAAGEKKADGPVGEQTFELKELSLSDAIEKQSDLAYSGQRVYLGFEKSEFAEDSTKPQAAVKKYPELKSAKPLYGSVQLSYNPLQPKKGAEYHFVIDATDAEKYDRLYFDANRNLDLTDDPPIMLNKGEGPAGLWPGVQEKRERILFEELSIPMDFGLDLGVRPVKTLPLLFVQEKKSATFMLISLTCYGGSLQIGDQPFNVILSQPHWIAGRFDAPGTGIYLTSAENRSHEYWWGCDRLGAYRLSNGKYYTMSATALGDKITVKPFDGELGVFRIGPGKRKIEKLQASGSLMSPDRAVAIGKSKNEEGNYASLEPVAECEIPEGDYAADLLSVQYGSLRISLSNNYHSDGVPRDMKREHKYAFQIRKDKPFVLDFSNQPDVMFASPAKDQTVHPGDEISVKAVLIDPDLDLMIRNLDDTREKVKKETELGDGKKTSYETTKSLDPLVTITDSSGKTVSEGPMPFG